MNPAGIAGRIVEFRGPDHKNSTRRNVFKSGEIHTAVGGVTTRADCGGIRYNT